VHEEAFRSGRHFALEEETMVLVLAIARGPVISWMAGSRSWSANRGDEAGRTQRGEL
jgi:hypothetical protein